MKHHLVILRPKYLLPILQGSKTVECRLSQRRSSPFGLVEPGDLLWLKETSGPIRGTATAGNVKSVHPLSQSIVNALQAQFGESMHVDSSFFSQRPQANFATLITLCDVKSIEPYRIQKHDRRAWIVLSKPPLPSSQQWLRP